MFKKLLLLTISFSILLLPKVAQASFLDFIDDDEMWALVEINTFEPAGGDYLVADIERSVGYLVSPEHHEIMPFVLLSGQKRFRGYFSGEYYEGTPEMDWVVRQLDIKGDRVTFGDTGRFFRMFDGEGRTAYGIHSHKYFQYMSDSDNYFRSLGCLIVSDDVLDVIQKSFELNGEILNVTTAKLQSGLDRGFVEMF